MMTSRERVIAAINHRQPDRVPIDLGATLQTGINASSLYQLRKFLGLEERDIHVHNISQMLGWVDQDLRDLIKPDVVGLFHPEDTVGIVGKGGKQRFVMPDGTPTLINEEDQYDVAPDGGIYMYPQGDRSAKPSIYMAPGGSYFNFIDRSPGVDLDEADEDTLTPREDFKTLFSVMSDETARYYERESKRLYEETNYAIVGNLSGAGFGDPGLYPGPFEKAPKGIRRLDDWCMAELLYPDYVHEVFSLQAETMLKNLEIYKQAVGDRIQVCYVSAKDFGTQTGEFMSSQMFKELYKPYYTKICSWIHENTGWKTFFHTCGSVVRLLDDFVDMGMDILNPVQLSASGMDPHMLKEKYGDKLVFWGGGVDTQNTLPRGTAEEVAVQVKERLEILSRDGGYVFNTIHNIVSGVPAENIWAAFNAVHDFNNQ